MPLTASSEAPAALWALATTRPAASAHITGVTLSPQPVITWPGRFRSVPWTAQVIGSIGMTP